MGRSSGSLARIHGPRKRQAASRPRSLPVHAHLVPVPGLRPRCAPGAQAGPHVRRRRQRYRAPSLSLQPPHLPRKADRRPIDPPPIVQLRVIDPAPPASPPASPPPPSHYPSHEPGPPPDAAAYAQSYLQNPYYFMFASLAKPDDDLELHWLKDGRTRCTTGSVVSSLYHLKDPQHNNQGMPCLWFVLSLRSLVPRRRLFRLSRSQCAHRRQLSPQTKPF